MPSEQTRHSPVNILGASVGGDGCCAALTARLEKEVEKVV